MRNQTHLFKRAGVYYSRVRIPRDLVEPLGGRQEIRLSLRTKERPEAVRRLRQSIATLTEYFYQLRGELSAGGAQ